LSAPSGSRHRGAGFSLVEIMVVVLIISLLATIALPTVIRVQRRTRTAAIQNDFRTFAAAFDTYAQETGGWPAESAAAVIPTGMDQRLNVSAWQRKTPMGGQYDWEGNQMHFGTRYPAAIAISATASSPLPLDVNQLTDLETVIDKGNFNWLGGSFHLGTGLVPLYIIQP
jgi:prepilin-type N-terminal cleavage/methylation domain-containing protein